MNNRPIPEGRTAVFIDGANSYATTRQLGFAIDYNALRDFLEGEYAPILRINYYTCVNEDDTERQTIRPLLDWLEYNGYNVIAKRSKTFDHEGRAKIKGSIDVDMAIDMITAASHVHNMVVFSGDSNIKRAIQVVQQMGVHVTVISSKDTTPSSVSDEMRRLADEYVDYSDIRGVIADKARQVVPA